MRLWFPTIFRYLAVNYGRLKTKMNTALIIQLKIIFHQLSAGWTRRQLCYHRNKRIWGCRLRLPRPPPVMVCCRNSLNSLFHGLIRVHSFRDWLLKWSPRVKTSAKLIKLPLFYNLKLNMVGWFRGLLEIGRKQHYIYLYGFYKRQLLIVPTNSDKDPSLPPDIAHRPESIWAKWSHTSPGRPSPSPGIGSALSQVASCLVLGAWCLPLTAGSFTA